MVPIDQVLPLLACPKTHAPLRLSADGAVLVSADGANRYPVIDGIPRLFGEETRLTQVLKENWGYKWEINEDILDYQENLFWDNMPPQLTSEFFKGKTVLEACCGAGVPDKAIAEAGARLVVGFDVSRAVEIAWRRTATLDRNFFVQTDLFDMPFRRASFDVVICLAALHHLVSPADGFALLKTMVRPGGTMIIWVYAYEGTAFVRHFVEPMRRLVCRIMPRPALNEISRGFALALWLANRSYRFLGSLPAVGGLARRLPLYDYLLYTTKWPFSKVHEMVLDQLIAPITHYIKRRQIEEWFVRDFTDVHISSLNRMSWRAIGVVTGTAQNSG
jgi:SAM-dependent methyltransferase